MMTANRVLRSLQLASSCPLSRDMHVCLLGHLKIVMRR